ncbi:MAG: DUF2064 domain-containing protein [Bacteroidota bacterium]
MGQCVSTPHFLISNDSLIYTRTPHTAILFFAREAKEEAFFKAWNAQGSWKVNQKISESLNQHTLRTAEATGLPVIWVDSTLQRGNSFGERLSHAFADVFEMGYQQVIAIGNDCPALTAADISISSELLSQRQLVAGGTQDGGVYLIGLHRDQFASQEFQSLTWETSDLQESLLQYAQLRKLDVQWLEEKTDLDTTSDLLFFIQTHRTRLAEILRQLLFSVTHTIGIHRSFGWADHIPLTLSSRGPPIHAPR